MNYTFSQHVALRKSSILYYVGLFAIVLPLLMLFFVLWFVPEFRISPWFSWLIGASSGSQLVCTFIPESGGARSQWHRLFAGVSGILLLPAEILLLFSPMSTIVDKVMVTMGVCTMSAVISQVVVAKGNPQRFLLLQSVYFAAFFVPVLTISYT